MQRDATLKPNSPSVFSMKRKTGLAASLHSCTVLAAFIFVGALVVGLF